MKKEARIKIIDGNYFFSKDFLLSNGLKKSTLYKKLKKANQGDSLHYQNVKIDKTTWIYFKSIPKLDLDKYKLPQSEKELSSYIIYNKKDYHSTELDKMFYFTWIEESLWIQYLPYYKEYYFDINIRNQYAKTHAIIQLIINYKNKRTYSLKQLFESYKTLKYVTFQTLDYKYFTKKIKLCMDNSIPETLIHDHLLNGRDNYRAIPLIVNRVKFYYLNNISRYSQRKICELVNEDLILRGLEPISLSTISRICRDPEIRNKADIIRLGKSYADNNINPYLTRKKASKIGELYMMDSTPLNFMYKTDENEISRLTLCAIIDVCSRKIVGYSFDNSENSKMICNALKMAFKENEVIPREILIDNGSSYSSDYFKALKFKLNEYGTNIRKARLKNPKDKGHIEGWFSKFQTEFLNILHGSLGDGIKTKRVGGRPDDELIAAYSRLKNMDTKIILIKKIEDCIKEYNNSYHNSIKTTPNKKFKDLKKQDVEVFNEKDISILFGLRKEIKVKNSMILFKYKKEKYHYTIQSRVLANKVNGTKLQIYHDELDLSCIHIFDLNNKYLGKLNEDIQPNIVAMNNNDFEIYQNSYNRIQLRTKENLSELISDIIKGKQELEIYPIISLKKNKIEKMEKIIEENDKVIMNSFSKYKIIEKSNSVEQLKYNHKLF